MIDALLELTALPNLHPAVVHFPLALLPVALLFEAVGLLWRRQAWLAPAATALYAAAAAGAGLAVWAGERAADGLVGVPPAVQPRIGAHSDWGHYAWYAMAALAVLRLAVHFLPALRERRSARLVALVLGLGACAVLLRAGDMGGALVYRHGLAVARPALAEPAPAPRPSAVPSEEGVPASPATDRLTRGADGTVAWRPLSGDGAALGAVLTAAPGASLDAVRWVEDRGGDGLVLEVESATVLLLPGVFGDVQVEATVALEGFAGKIGVAHHIGGDEEVERGGYFLVDTAGGAELVAIASGEREVLDDADVDLPRGPTTLAVSAAGKHLKGMIDGATVTHGHTPAPPDGGCGLVLGGRGRLRLLALRAIPIAAH